MSHGRILTLTAVLAIATGCESGYRTYHPQAWVVASGGREDHSEQVIEAISLLGEPLERPSLTPTTRGRLQANLDSAWDRMNERPDDEMSFVWLGRRLAYLGRYEDAIATYSAGLQEHPGSYRLRRHRGHRYITTRQLDLAIGDLAEAERIVIVGGIPDEIEQDGAPNERNIPLTTTHSNIYYHLALAHYLKGDYESALATHRRGERFGRGNDDGIVSSGYWVYRCLRELGRDDEARIELERVLRPNMEIIENHAYLAALRAYEAGGPFTLPASGDGIQDATLGYGLAAELMAEGRRDEAIAAMESIVVRGEPWAAFGFIAAEARLAQMRDD